MSAAPRRAVHLGVSLLPTLLLCCSKGSEGPAPSQAATVQLQGSGSSFAAPLLAKWAAGFRQARPEVEIGYRSVGSSRGIQDVTDESVDFAATEAPLSDDEMAQLSQRRGYGLYHLPAAIGGDVPAYNLPGIKDVRFTPAILAGIYLGTIKKWSAPELLAANPGVTLPDANITVVHRSDGSGTTYIWADYLSKVSEEWREKVGRGATVNWPVGLPAKGNEGVSAKVNTTVYSIGYVELIYAVQSNLQYGPVQNADGEFVKANLASLTAAAVNVSQSRPEDYRVSITNGAGKGVYPVVGFTWLLVPGKISDPAKRKAMIEFLRWSLADGQRVAEGLSFAGLPERVIANERLTLARIQ